MAFPQFTSAFFVRILVSFLWFPVIVLAVNMFLGVLVGGFAGADKQGFNAGYYAGAEASINFFVEYGRLVYLLEIIAWFLLCLFGVLPGTKLKGQGTETCSS